MTSSSATQQAPCARIAEVWTRLAKNYGQPRNCPSGDPRASLVQTVLSQHTTDASAGRAYVELRHRFPTWETVERAHVEDVADSIKSAGLATQKATTIQLALRELSDGDLSKLAQLPVSEARARLTSVRGVGEKTASCVLLFALGMPAQPVDTHIERVSKRIGINGAAKTAPAIQDVLENCLPADGQTMYAFHVDLIRHGRQVCTARDPQCSRCFLNDICNYFAASRQPAEV